MSELEKTAADILVKASNAAESAGKPYVMPLHRAMPIDFVLPDEDEKAVRDGFDAAMKAPISKREEDVETVEQYDRDAGEIAWVGWLLCACLLCVIFSGLGYLAGRYLS